MEVTIRKPDTEKPDIALLREAYELASEVYDMEPWIDFIEEQVLAIEFADGARRFLSVMGRFGTHLAVALYPDMGTYWRIRSIREDDEADALDAFMSTHQLQLVFCRAADLMKGERASIKASGVKFPRGVNPSFVSYMPGFAPDAMGAGEMRETLRFIRAFFGFRKDHMSFAVRPLNSPHDLISTWAEGADGSWTFHEDEFAGMLPVAVSVDNSLISKVAALKTNAKMFLEVGVYPVPVGRTPSGRGKMSKVVLLVDHESHLALTVNVFETPDDRETDWAPMLDFALETMLKGGFRPGRIATNNSQMGAVLGNLCASNFAGTEYVPHATCSAANEVFDMISSRMFR